MTMSLFVRCPCRTLSSPSAVSRLYSVGSRVQCLSTTAVSARSGSIMTDSTRHLLEDITLSEQQDSGTIYRKRMSLARAITLVESKHARHRQQADLLLTELLKNNSFHSTSFRLGIAGPPGAGKSTWIERFGMYLLEPERDIDYKPNKLAVVCVDPSSSVTGGSILGDKTRMMELSRHKRAYVRPSSNGGTFGGLSAYTHDVVSLCQAASYDLCIVESVGLGQSEVEIAQSVDMLVLIIPPGGGDELQGVKKGIMEVADLVLVNKADGNLLQAARSTKVEYLCATKFLRPKTQGWTTPVLLTSAYTGEGIDKVWSKISEFRRLLEETGDLTEKRRQQATYWMWKNLQNCIMEKTRKDSHLQKTAHEMERALNEGTITPRVAASTLLESLVHDRTT